MPRREVEMRHAIGVDSIMWGSDFPHAVTSFPKSRHWLEIIFQDVPASLRRAAEVQGNFSAVLTPMLYWRSKVQARLNAGH